MSGVSSIPAIYTLLHLRRGSRVNGDLQRDAECEPRRMKQAKAREGMVGLEWIGVLGFVKLATTGY